MVETIGPMVSRSTSRVSGAGVAHVIGGVIGGLTKSISERWTTPLPHAIYFPVVIMRMRLLKAFLKSSGVHLYVPLTARNP